MQLIPVRSPTKVRRFNLVREIDKALARNNLSLSDGDILAISGKYMALSQARYVEIKRVRYLDDSKEMAVRYGLSPGMVEIIVREADYILRGLSGFLLTIKDGYFAPNAGIDKSNIFKGYAILHPFDPSAEAKRIREWALIAHGAKIGVVVTDSRLQPLRMGTVGIAIGASGIRAIEDERGKKDLFGNYMKVTRRAVADNIASAVQLLMGETDEAVPIVIVRGSGIELDRNSEGLHISVPVSQCIYVRGLSAFSDKFGS
ncbi:MAG: coenzyme F420-0:L-glutamate ligase [Nitrososphaerota archaeon]